MSPKWTASQQQALELRGTNLLVSAGAGSGKTTVLTHRILERIKNGDSITDFLVVTFTKAAAAGMRERIGQAIARRVGAGRHVVLGDLKKENADATVLVASACVFSCKNPFLVWVIYDRAIIVCLRYKK